MAGRSTVDVFDDRIEVTNPGGLYGGKTRENLFDGSSRCRNATLVKLMSIVPLPDGAGSPAEGNGSGIPMMIDAMRAHGLAEPLFCPGFDRFEGRTLPFKDRAGRSWRGLNCDGTQTLRRAGDA